VADLTLLRTFMAVYRGGSMTHAAARLHMTQPGVSHQVKALEAQIGQPLFVRRARGVTPTPRAVQLADSIGPHVEALESVASTVRPDSALAEVEIGGPPDVIGSLVLPILATTRDLDARIRARAGTADWLDERLRNGEIDVVVSMRAFVGGALEHERVGREPRVVVVSPEHEARLCAARLSPDEALAREPRILVEDDLPALPEIAVPAPRTVSFVVPDLRAALAACEAGAGIAVLPRFLAAAALRSGSLTELVLDRPPPDLAIWLGVRAGRRRAPAVDRVYRALATGLARRTRGARPAEVRDAVAC
jgi:DNA-binding transcriptional LysR family regulator